MFPKSIRWKIQAWHGTLLVCLVGGLLATFYAYERNARFLEIDSQLESLLTPLLPRISRPPRRTEFNQQDFPPPGPPQDNGPVPFPEFENGSFYYVAWSSPDTISSQSSGAPVVPYPGPDSRQPAPGNDSPDGRPPPPPPDSHRALIRTRDEFREIVHYGRDSDCVVIGTSTAPVTRQLHRLALALVGGGIALVAFGLAGGWWMAGRALRPIAEISATAETIAGGQRSRRINVRETQSELGQLAAVLNNTFERMEQAYEQQVRFTADASHELRTPISVILTQVQLALSRDRTAPEYRETLQVCEQIAERMRTLVNSLLELARVDSGEFELTLVECDLAQLGRESLDFITPLAGQKNVTLRNELEAVKIMGDPLKLGQVLTNLLHNAIKHNPDGIEVSLSIQREEDRAVLRVTDNGAGISDKVLPHIFDRFYRGDKSRSRAKGSTGLGLAITKAIVKAHGGSIRVQSKKGEGTTFTVELPLQKRNS